MPDYTPPGVSAGEIAWTSWLNNAFSRVKDESVQVKPSTRVFLHFQFGYKKNHRIELAIGENRIRRVLLSDWRKRKVLVYLEFQEHTLRGGRVKREKVLWEHSTIYRNGEWHVAFHDRNLRLDSQTVLKKLRTVPIRPVYPALKVKRKAFGVGGDPSDLPSYPVTKTAYVVHADERSGQLKYPPYSIPFTVISDGAYESYRLSRTSVRTPGFGNLKAKELPVNPFSSTITKTEDGQALQFMEAIIWPGWSSFWWYDHKWFRTSVTIGSLLPPPLSHDTTAYNKSMNKVLERSQQEITGNLLQDIGQFGQTVRLVSNTTARLVGSVRALKRFRFQKALGYLWHGSRGNISKHSLLSHSKTLANNWLEFQYAWKPLLRDVQAAMESLAQYLAKDSTVKVVRGSGRTEQTVKKPIYGSANVLLGYLTIVTVTYSRIGLRYKVADHLKAFAAQTGFTNPINFLWEVIPFSFVADWFYPIGPYLEKLSSFEGLEFKDGFQTYFTKRTISADFSFDGQVQSLGGRYRHVGKYFREEIKVDRVKLTTFPEAKIPKLKSPLSVTHALNGIALVVAVFGGRLRK